MGDYPAEVSGSGFEIEYYPWIGNVRAAALIPSNWRGAGLAFTECRFDERSPVIRFLARNPGVEAGEVSERARMVVPAGI